MGTEKLATPKSDRLTPIADGVEVTFYTDPLCCWSWAMATAWDKLVKEFGSRIEVIYKMGGLLPSWKHFQDGAHSINRPAQMGPEWMHAAHLSGVTMNSRLWITDPPASSYPACIAVKCAQLQSEYFGEKYLRILREAVMVEGRNIARNEVLIEAAWLLYDQHRNFDLLQFRSDLMGERGKQAFRDDLQEAKYFGINRFPSLVIKRENAPAILLTGYQTYDFLKASLGGQEQGGAEAASQRH